jgi:hypothetical protein
LGELVQKKYEIFVNGMNKELKSRKLKEKEKMRIDIRFQPLASDLESEFQLPLQAPPQQSGFQPQTEEELDDFFDREYKDIAEIIMTAALKYLAKLNRWDYHRIAIFRDILIMGMGFCRNEVVDGIPRAIRVDPRNMVWDANATDDFLTDSTYFGELEYKNIGDVIDEFGISKKELEQIYGEYKDFMSLGGARTKVINDWDLLNANSGLRWFKEEGGELRVLVCRAVWVDFKPWKHKYSTDKYGNQHIKKVDSDTTDQPEIKKNLIKIWRKGTLIGGKILKNWGEMENQARNWSNLSNVEPPYKAIIPNYMNNMVVSKVYMMQNLQSFKNLALYRLQLDMARSGTKAFFYDINQLPEGYSLPQALKYMKTAGVIPIDASQSSYNQFKEVDQTISSNITAYLEISALMDREMDAISGINEARQGMVKNASQAVGVTQSSLFQSTLSTAVYYDLFSQFCSQVLEHQAKLVKLAWAGKERFAPIIGDVGVDFLQVDIDMDLHDYAVFVEEVPPMLQDQQVYQEMIVAAVQAGQLTFVQAIKLLLEKDIRVGIRQLERETRKMMEQQQQQEQALMMQQQQQLEAEQAMRAADAEQSMAEVDAKNRNNIDAIRTQGRIQLRGQMLDFKQQLVLDKLNREIEMEKIKAAKQKAAAKPKSK